MAFEMGLVGLGKLQLPRSRIELDRADEAGRCLDRGQPAVDPHLAPLNDRFDFDRVAKELEHGGGDRVFLDLVRGADLFESALGQDGDAVGELQRLVLVVGHEDRGLAGAVVDLAKPAAQVLPHLGVEGAEGSSNSSSRGSTARARASAMRWRWPPESCDG